MKELVFKTIDPETPPKIRSGIFTILERFEGLYNNDPADIGKETVWGISREYHPDWEGWSDLEKAKKTCSGDKNCFNIALQSPILKEKVYNFYLVNFVEPLHIGKINDHRISYELLEQAINMGIPKAVKNLQKSLNAFGFNLKVDGKIGSKTIDAVNRAKEEEKRIVFNIMNFYQGIFYAKIFEKRPAYRKFLGLFNRTETKTRKQWESFKKYLAGT